MKQTRLIRAGYRLPLVIFIAATVVSLSSVYQNQIYKFIHRPVLSYTAFAWEEGPYGVSISNPGASDILQLKISLGLSATRYGCEYLYAAVVSDYANLPSEGNLLVTHAPRSLIKFSYDLKNKRCESKDLSLHQADAPERIRVQFVDTSVSDSDIEEIPREEGLEIRFDAQPTLKPAAFIANIPKEAPFLRERRTSRQKKFSSSLLPGEAELIIPPDADLRERLIREFQSRIERCRSEKRCDRIQIATSLVTDPELIQLIEQASKVGMEVENINCWSPRKWGYKTMPWDKTLYRENAAWSWMRGNADFNRVSFLPMHTKFIIFGDDLVISSNSNYDLDLFYKTREVAIAYRSPTIVKMFQEIFALIRTSVFYPLHVDLQDSFILLYNADRPRGYSASSMKPFQSIETNEGLSSTAYGILFELINREKGGLLLNMSPISNSCAFYRQLNCLETMLEKRVSENRVRFLLNFNFYQPWKMDEPRFWDPRATFWSRAAIQQELPSVEQNLNFYLRLNEKQPGSVMLKSMMHQRVSNHHARTGTLGEDILLNGSANYARPSTLNTIEFIRNKEIRKQYDSDVATFDEPYFIAKAGPRSLENFTQGKCEFVFERDLLRKDPYLRKRFHLSDLRETAQRTFPEANPDSIYLIRPVWNDRIFEDQERYLNPPFEQVFLRDLKAENFESVSSFFCFGIGFGNERILRVDAANTK